MWKPSSLATLSFWAILALHTGNPALNGTRRVAETRTDLHRLFVRGDMYVTSTVAPEAQPPRTTPGPPRPLPRAVGSAVLANMQVLDTIQLKFVQYCELSEYMVF